MVFIIIFFIVHWYLSLFCQTFFLHRYAAHGMFSMSRFWEKYFSVLTYVTQGSSYLSPRAYGILHKMHHAYSDTEKDPHSPHNSSNIFTMMWKTKDAYLDYVYDRRRPEARFEMKPMMPKLEDFGNTWFSRFLWGTGYTLIYIFAYNYMGMPWYMFALLPVQYMMGPVHGAIVNWSGHKYGYSNYDNNDKSKNSLIFDFLLMGELFQNNHHKLPNRAQFSTKWFEFDPTYPLMIGLQKVGIIKMKTA